MSDRAIKAFQSLVSLDKSFKLSPKVLVKPRKWWFRPDITEKWLTGTLSLNTNKTKNPLSLQLIFVLFLIGYLPCSQVADLVEQKCRSLQEKDKFRSYIEDMDKIIKLLLKLSGLLARAENTIQGLTENTNEKIKVT